MRQLTVLVCAFAIALSANAQIARTDLDAPEDMILGFRGKSKYQIIVPDVAANPTAESSVTRAAELLQQAFAANKITLPVVKESQAEAGRPGFYVGATKFAAANGASTASPVSPVCSSTANAPKKP